MMHYSPQQMAAALGGNVAPNGQVLAPGPNHSPKDRSLAVRLDPAAPDGFVVYSFAGDDPLQCKDHVRSKLGMGQWQPKPKANPLAAMLRRAAGNSVKLPESPPAVSVQIEPKPTPPAEYIYQTGDGTPYLRVKRTAEKDFYQQHWNGAAWQNGAPAGPKIPYRLPELMEAEHDTVFICEGEKDADRLASLGLVATTNSGGAGKWPDELNAYFDQRDVYILPDNDPAGEQHAAKVSESLAGVARDVRIIRLPGLPEKGDVSDWLDAGGTVEQLSELMKAVPQENEAAPRLIVSSSEFIAGFVPPDYLIDGLVQRRFCYSMTAPTGSGKTAVALLLSAHVALGRPIGEYQLEQGRVLYLAGENPDDIRMRWLVMADRMEFDIDQVPVHFLPGVFKLSEIAGRIRDEVEVIGPVSLVVVDTSAAYFEGDQENDNVQMGLHARRMRSLVSLPGEPCVIVACHPVKNAGPETLLPRGGGAFVAEVDGNLTCSRSDTVVTLHWQGKFRGPDFAPALFHLTSATTPALTDSKGRSIPSVYAKPLSEGERRQAEANSGGDEDALLLAIADNARASFAGLAIALGWISAKGENKAKVKRCADRLKKDRLVKPDRKGTLCLTDLGETEVKRLRSNLR
jgi:hypothetical protein